MGRTKKKIETLAQPLPKLPLPAIDITWRPLAELRPDPNQPRKEFILDDILATLEGDNPRIWEPLRIRPTRPDERNADGSGALEPFTIIEGERRWRSACKKGLAMVPCLPPEDINEATLRCMQIASAATKRPLRPLEQADAIKSLYEGPARLSPEAIALRTGLGSVRLVHRALALAGLCTEVRKALVDDVITEKVAVAIATVTNHESQKSALASITKNDGHNLKNAKETIEREFHLVLVTEKCGFDPADARLPGGPCNRCPKNTTAQRSLGLLDDAKSDGKCTDKPCFDKKCDEMWVRHKAVAIGMGVEVIEEPESLKLYPNAWDRAPSNETYVDLDEIVYSTNKTATYRELLGDYAKYTVLVYAHRKIHQCMLRTEVVAALVANGQKEQANEEARTIAEIEERNGEDDEARETRLKEERDRWTKENAKRAVERATKRAACLAAIDATDGVPLWRFLAGLFLRELARQEGLTDFREQFGLAEVDDGEDSTEGDIADAIAWLAEPSRTSTELAQVVAYYAMGNSEEYLALGAQYADSRAKPVVASDKSETKPRKGRKTK